MPEPKRSIGTKIKIGSDFITGLTSITTPKKTADTIDTTTLDNSDGYKTFIQSWKDGGEVSVTGFFLNGDSGQVAMDSAFEDGGENAFQIIFPSTIGATWSFNGVVTAYGTGDVDNDNLVPFEATIKISGKPTLGTSASAGLSALSLTGTGGTLAPAFDNGTQKYLFDGVSATSVTVTATAASHTLLLFVDGVYSATLTTAVASSAIAVTIDVVKTLTIVAFEDNKSPVVYEIDVLKTS